MIGEGFDIPTGRRVEESTMNMCLIPHNHAGWRPLSTPKFLLMKPGAGRASGWAL